MPEGFTVMNPYGHDDVRRVVTTFCERYYGGSHQRLAVWGINPGRFGAGLTGLSFTDPHALRVDLGIESSIVGRREPSAEFIYTMIAAYGGPASYYHDVYMSALSPLGFLRNGVNINFYDDAAFMREIVPFVVDCMRAQTSFGLRSDACVVLGTGKLKQFMERYVQPELQYQTVRYLEHPRFIMQYRRRFIGDYVTSYVTGIRDLVGT